MLSIRPLLDHAAPFLLVVFRLAGLFIFAPLLSGRLIPRRVRALVAVVFAGAVYPALPDRLHAPPDAALFDLLPMMSLELLIGVTVGLLAALPLIGMELAGLVMGHQMGLGIARSYNPEADTDSEALGQVCYYLGLGAFLAVGGLNALFLAVLRSFERIPMGGMGRPPLDLLVGILSSSFELALRAAAPAVCAVFLVMIAVGFVMKTMPQINVMSVGFAVKILCGLGALTASVAVLEQVAGEEILQVLGAVLRWAGG